MLIAGSVLGPVQLVQCCAVKVVYIVLCLSLNTVYAAAAAAPAGTLVLLRQQQQKYILQEPVHRGQCSSLYCMSLQSMLAST